MTNSVGGICTLSHSTPNLNLISHIRPYKSICRPIGHRLAFADSIIQCMDVDTRSLIQSTDVLNPPPPPPPPQLSSASAQAPDKP